MNPWTRGGEQGGRSWQASTPTQLAFQDSLNNRVPSLTLPFTFLNPSHCLSRTSLPPLGTISPLFPPQNGHPQFQLPRPLRPRRCRSRPHRPRRRYAPCHSPPLPILQLTLPQATLDDLDDPLATNANHTSTSDRAPLVSGNISSAQTQSYLTSSIPGEDRRAPQNTLDETVWATLSRDLLAVWEKMRQVLYPKYLLGGAMRPSPSMEGGADGGAGAGQQGFGAGLMGVVGRWPDADVVLQGGMSEGLRDWDLWGPLLFCLLLSFLLSRGAQDEQKSVVFSGVFAIVWIGEAVVTLQIKLLGGNM